ncbi:MAG: BlaI/MecI/CopY family transcriptional regulator [Asticcacaulis sp.]|uniref:BlaI/MecI/CopY family transcriptional regulator n=1 Tax=Asticcacaulis sp. TaxID=1872648 RepID=UPI0039E44985
MTRPHLAITDAERVLMEILWRTGPLSPAELMAAVKAVESWAEPTIKTLLHRLMQRGAVKSEKREARLQYVTQISRDAYLEQQVEALVDRLFDGNRQALIAYLNQQG